MKRFAIPSRYRANICVLLTVALSSCGESPTIPAETLPLSVARSSHLHPITIDATGLSAVHLSLVGGPSWTNSSPHNLNLAPGAYAIAISTFVGPEPRIAFTVDATGKVDYDSTLEGLLVGSGTSTLSVIGVSLAIDATALDAAFYSLRAGDEIGLVNDQSHSLQLWPSGYRITYSTFVGPEPNIVFSLDANGDVSYDASLEGLLLGAGTSTLSVVGVSLTVDATPLDATPSFAIRVGQEVAFVNDQPHAIQLWPSGYRFAYLDTGTPSQFQFSVDAAGLLDYDASLDALLSGRGSNTLVVGFRTPEEQIQDLTEAIAVLVAAGSLAADKAADIEGKLDAALQKLQVGQTAKGIKQLEDLVKRINRLIEKGDISSADGSSLITQLQELVADLGL